MAGVLSQLPLPWIPDGAAEVARGVGLEPLPGGGGAVWVHGLMTFCWEGGDEAGRRLAAVQLAELKAATQQQVADAFGIKDDRGGTEPAAAGCGAHGGESRARTAEGWGELRGASGARAANWSS